LQHLDRRRVHDQPRLSLWNLLRHHFPWRLLPFLWMRVQRWLCRRWGVHPLRRLHELLLAGLQLERRLPRRLRLPQRPRTGQVLLHPDACGRAALPARPV